MRRFLVTPLSVLALTGITAPSLAADEALRTPSDIVEAAPASDWKRIAPDDLVVMDLAPDAQGRARRVVIQLIPAPFSQGWVGNIRKLVAAHWFDGIAVVRMQDNYVVQWGDPDGETPGKAKALPEGLQKMSEAEYQMDTDVIEAPRTSRWWTDDGHGIPKENFSIDSQLTTNWLLSSYSGIDGFWAGWPVGMSNSGKGKKRIRRSWPVHCYGMVGVGRNMSPDTGTGAELYTVIGQAPRQLDRNIALVGRIIAGIEHLSSLPRGTGPLGFYETPQERTPIVSMRMGSEVTGLPAYEYLTTDSSSFAAYVDKRANRKDDFYIQPAGGVDVCNVPVPVRPVPVQAVKP